jgi:hypothetical protein
MHDVIVNRGIANKHYLEGVILKKYLAGKNIAHNEQGLVFGKLLL